MLNRIRLVQLLVAVSLGAALLVGLDGLDPAPAKAGKRYGSKGYCNSRPCLIKKCNQTCGRANKTCVYCSKRDLQPLKAECHGNADPKTCRKAVKLQMKSRLSACVAAKGSCKPCCKANYNGSCTNAFTNTSGFGTYFRTVKRYGKTKTYKPTCDGITGPVGGCTAACDQARAAGLRSCGKRCDTAVIEARYQECLSACNPTTTTLSTSTTIIPSTTTLITSTTTTQPGSAAVAFTD